MYDVGACCCRKLYDGSVCGSYDSLKKAFQKRRRRYSKHELDIALLCSAYKGIPECVNLLLDKRADITATDKNGDNALILAATKGYTEIVEILLRRGCPPDTTNVYHQTALLKACVHKHPTIVKLLCCCISSENSANKDQSKKNRPTVPQYERSLLSYDLYSFKATIPLIEAVRVENVQIVKMLLGAKFSAKETNTFRETALHIAAAGRSTEIIDILVTAGADINAIKKGNITPLMIAVIFKREENILLLLKHGADAAIGHNWYGYKTCILSEAIYRSASERVIGALCEAGAELNYRDKLNRTALSRAVEIVNFPLIKCLIRYGCKVNTVSFDQQGQIFNSNRSTLLQFSIQTGSIELVQLLYRVGAFSNKNLFEFYTEECSEESTVMSPLVEVVITFATNPGTLALLCCKTINNEMELPLPLTISQLNLPPPLRDFLLYTDI